MKRIELSQINFPLETKRYTKKIKEVIQLYRECKYDEAETLAAKLNGYDPQLADMRAQLAFFRSDFNECVQQGIMVYPFLNEWYSENKRKQTERLGYENISTIFTSGKIAYPMNRPLCAPNG